MRTGKLMAAAEIGRRLGVGRTRVKHYIALGSWPAPFDRLDVGRVWLTADVEAWIAIHRPDLVEETDTAE